MSDLHDFMAANMWAGGAAVAFASLLSVLLALHLSVPLEALAVVHGAAFLVIAVVAARKNEAWGTPDSPPLVEQLEDRD